MSTDEPILTISVAATLIELHPRTLMLYEKTGLIGPHRTNTKRRMFSVKNLEELQFVKYLTKEKGINLQGVKAILDAIHLVEKDGIDLRKQLFPAFRARALI